MRKYRLRSIPEHGVGADTETDLIQRGLLSPPIVCGSVAWFVDMPVPAISGSILNLDETLELFRQVLEDPDKILVGANIPFDLLVVATEFAKRGVDIMPAIFKALEDNRIYDLQTAEALNAVAQGCLGIDPRNHGPLKNPETGKRGRYSLATCVDLVLGRVDAKTNDEWRMRYAELRPIPMSKWPETALQYPVDDAKNTLECALAQIGFLKKTTPEHNWGADGVCLNCGINTVGHQCLVKRSHRNLHDLANQVYTHFAMHLGAAWGFHVNQDTVDIIERHALATREAGLEPFSKIGLIRPDGSENRSELKRRVALAYGSSEGEQCPVCLGSGKVPSPVNPKSKIICFAVENGVKVKTCDGTGLVLGGDVPRSEKDGIGYGRDVLHESGDELLMDYAIELEGKKTLDVYVPYLREGRVQDTVTGRWKDVPLTLRPNVLLETGRTSYDGVIQLFPRAPGRWEKTKSGGKVYIPSLRETIEARKGYLFSSEDYKAGELYTHAQSCIWLVGHSDLALALLRDIDPHSALAATVLGVTYQEFIKRKKEPKFKNARQAAKPFTFGKPGGMGSAKLVAQQRKQGPDTPCPNGPSEVDDGNGNKVPGYKGLRFCILMDGATSCGSVKTTMWGKIGREQKIAPTCVHCLECADRLGETWLRQWSENKPYFNYIQTCVENGQTITAEALMRWPHLQEVFSANYQLAPGEIMQHVSGRIRGGVNFTSGANGFFQGLLGDVCKAALRRVARECYDKTVRVPTLAHENSRPSAYANMPSPLYGSRPVGFFHDELFLEHPESMGHDAATRTAEIMAEEMMWYCPDVAATAGAEPTLMRKWFKSAEKVVENGRLVCWEPKES